VVIKARARDEKIEAMVQVRVVDLANFVFARGTFVQQVAQMCSGAVITIFG